MIPYVSALELCPLSIAEGATIIYNGDAFICNISRGIKTVG
jgi:hypothetical protein